jgi:hypothetical protein
MKSKKKNIYIPKIHFIKNTLICILFKKNDYKTSKNIFSLLIFIATFTFFLKISFASDKPRVSTISSSEQKKLYAKESSNINFSKDDLNIYRSAIKDNTLENISDKTVKLVRRKIESRKNMSLINNSYPEEPRFGLHGIEIPFIKSSMNDSKVREIYNILSKVGIQNIGTAESTWHRLGENFNNFTELDYQVKNANDFGIKLIFTVGYPPEKYNVASSVASTFKPEHEILYRKYLRSLFKRYKGIFKEVSLGNEVDAPDSWWIGATPSMYVRDCKILKHEVHSIDPTVKIVTFGSTGSRNISTNSTNPYYGRKFLKKSFEEGINNCADVYSIHYTWSKDQKDFSHFFISTIDKYRKDIYVTEDSAYGKPADIIKMFARNLFLYDYKRTYYYPARDYYEGGQLLYTGLFDPEWNPKLRLLPYALSVDAMIHRSLFGMAEPAPNIEAYILENKKLFSNKSPKYSIVIWRNLPKFRGEFSFPRPMNLKDINQKASPVKVTGFKNVTSAYNWQLDPIQYDLQQPTFHVDNDPIVIFTNKIPNWTIISRETWLSRI